MSKASDERITPDWFFDDLDTEFGFELDAAATVANRKCYHFFGPGSLLEPDALTPRRPWHHYAHSIFLNPPYSNLKGWLAAVSRETRLAREANSPLRVVVLLPTDTSTRWFHDYLWDDVGRRWRRHVLVTFPGTRLAFGPHTNSAKTATMVAIFT